MPWNLPDVVNKIINPQDTIGVCFLPKRNHIPYLVFSLCNPSAKHQTWPSGGELEHRVLYKSNLNILTFHQQCQVGASARCVCLSVPACMNLKFYIRMSAVTWSKHFIFYLVVWGPLYLPGGKSQIALFQLERNNVWSPCHIVIIPS